VAVMELILGHDKSLYLVEFKEIYFLNIYLDGLMMQCFASIWKSNLRYSIN